jgi:uncharacterized protein (DUF488 family)
MSPIFTIGHGIRPLPTFLNLLDQYSIDFLIDIRSVPYSAYNPQYRQDELARALREVGIRYVYLGDALGGRPSDPSCYNSDGKIDYEKVSTKGFFKAGLERVIIAYEKNIRVALMCSESKPANCHRSKLVGRALQHYDIPVAHIDENGVLRAQQQLINQLF